jgi:hypothetical protein
MPHAAMRTSLFRNRVVARTGRVPMKPAVPTKESQWMIRVLVRKIITAGASRRIIMKGSPRSSPGLIHGIKLPIANASHVPRIHGLA